MWSRTQCISVCLSAGPGYFLFLVLVPTFTVIEPLICICRCFCRSNPLAKSDCLWQLKRQAEHALIGCHIPHKVHLEAFAKRASQRSLCSRYDVCYRDKQVSVCSDKSVILKSATLQHQEPIAMLCMLSTAIHAAISSQWVQRTGARKQIITCVSLCSLGKGVAVDEWKRHISPPFLVETSIEHIQELDSSGWQVQNGMVKVQAPLWQLPSLHEILSIVLNGYHKIMSGLVGEIEEYCIVDQPTFQDHLIPF